MERLGILEKKLGLLIESKKHDAERIGELSMQLEEQKEEGLKLLLELELLKTSTLDDVTRVQEENLALKSQVEQLENTLLVRHQNMEGLNQERELTKMAVDDLIKSIDTLIEAEQ